LAVYSVISAQLRVVREELFLIRISHAGRIALT
jgi:hypothetical protein